MKETGMKQIGFVLVISLLAGQAWSANYSMINCKAPTGTFILVYLNGKLINQNPADEVSAKSGHGCNSIFIEVVEKSTGHHSNVQKDIDIEPGYEVYLTIKMNECGPEIIQALRYPLFSNYLYNKNRYAIRNIS
jgi:hypothetical protein